MPVPGGLTMREGITIVRRLCAESSEHAIDDCHGNQQQYLQATRAEEEAGEGSQECPGIWEPGENSPVSVTVMASEKSSARLDQVVARASRERVARDNAYRERALKMYPWVCGRCAREFNRENLRELTVHHRDHDHDNNPLDGSNWELLCVYCHDNEHSRLVDPGGAGTDGTDQPVNVATYNPFAKLAGMLKEKK